MRQQDLGQYDVKGVKGFHGRQGLGFNATLTHNGRKVAFVTDHANGGIHSFVWAATTPEQRAADEAALGAHIATLPPIDLGNGDTAPMDEDFFVTQLVERYENAARFRRMLKTKVVLLDDTNSVLTVPAKPDPAMLAAAEQKWPKWRVLNRLPVDEAVALMHVHVKEG